MIIFFRYFNNACKFGFALGFIIFFLNLCIFIAFIYGRTLVGKEINTNKGRDFTGGDVMLSLMVATRKK